MENQGSLKIHLNVLTLTNFDLRAFASRPRSLRPSDGGKTEDSASGRVEPTADCGGTLAARVNQFNQ